MAAAYSTTTTVTGPASASSYGQTITFTATVSAAGGTGPAGFVTFVVDGVSQAPTALTSGTAAFTTAAFSVGSHTVSAIYGGNLNYLGSTSATVRQSVGPAAAAKLVINGQPTAGTPGQALSPAVTVLIEDAFGNVETGDSTDSVTMSVASGPGGFSAASTITATATAGSVTFNNLALNLTGSYTLTAAATGLASATAPITINNTSDVQTDGLDFKAIGGQFVQSGNGGSTYTSNSSVSDVQVGFVPTGSQAFVPLLDLNGTVTIDTSAETLAATGTVSEAIDGKSISLLNGTAAVSISALTSTGLNGLSGLSFPVAGVSFTPDSLALNATGAAGQPEIQLQGTLGLPAGLTVAVNGSNYVDISNSGVSLTGINDTINGSFSVGGATFSANQLTVQYQTANNVFTITGSATAAIGGIANFSVDLGGTGTQGLVIQNDTLQSLNMTVNSNITIDDVTFDVSSMVFTYTAGTGTSPSLFTMTGDASFDVTGIGSVNVDFGGTGTQGLVVTNGSLTSLNMTVNSNITIDAVTFDITNMVLTYTGSTDTFTMTGDASFAVTGIASVNVDFGGTGTQGLVVTNGSLTSLDMTVNSNISIDAVTFDITDMVFTYTGSTDTFTMTGDASFAVTGIASVNVDFGGTGTQGLVVTNGSLTSLDKKVNCNITIDDVTFDVSSMVFTYTAGTGTSPSLFTMTGDASFDVTGIGSVNVDFGGTGTQGLVVTNGSLTSLNMTVNSNITIDAVTLDITNMVFTYTAGTGTNTSLFTMTGDASFAVTGIGSVNVDFGGQGTQGLVVTNGSLTSLDMTVNSNISIDAVTFDISNMVFTYTSSTDTFTMTGDASFAVTGIASVNVDFGGQGTQGLVVTNGSLTSLDMTVNSNISIDAVTFDISNMVFTYTASTDTFTMTGDASFAVAGIASVNVDFGGTGTQGLVVTNGSLTSLDMTVNSNITIDAVTFDISNMVLTYTAGTSTSPSVFTMTGDASFALAGIGSLEVDFGGQGTQGLVVTNGSLTSLDMTVNGSARIGLVSFAISNMVFTYTGGTSTSPSVFTMTGDTSFAVGGIGSVQVDFGGQGTQGLFIENGHLQSLDMTVNSNITIAAVTFDVTNMVFTYTASTDAFTMTGDASFAVAGIGSLDVDFGGQGTQGLIVQNGRLQSLNMTVNASITLDLITFDVSNMVFTYTAGTTTSPSFFTMTGDTSIDVLGIGSLDVDFGGQCTRGMVITNGSLTSLNMTANGQFGIDGIGFDVSNMVFTFNSGTFTMTGDTSFNVPGMGSLDVDFGGHGTQGLVVTNGSLTSLDMTVNSSFTVGFLNFAANNLEFKYSAATNEFSLAGSTTVAVPFVPDIGSLTVTFGHGSTPGLVITNGSLTSLDMTVNAHFGVDLLTFDVSNMEFAYTAATNTFTMTGDASFDLAGIATIDVQFGQNGTHGLVITNGSLTYLDMNASANFGIGPMSISGNLLVTYHASYSYTQYVTDYITVGSANIPTQVPETVTVPAQFVITGNASGNLFGILGVSVDLGGSGTQGLVITNGSLTALNFAVTADAEFLGIEAQAQLTATYQSSVLTLSGTADVSLTFLPSWAETFLGSSFGVNFYVQAISGDLSDSYVDIYTSVLGDDIGIRVSFTGQVSIEIGDPWGRSYMRSNMPPTWPTRTPLRLLRAPMRPPRTASSAPTMRPSRAWNRRSTPPVSY